MKSGLAILLVVLVSSTVRGEDRTVYDDGARHIHDATDPSVDVRNSTQLEVVDPADIALLRVHDTSQLTMAGGQISHIHLLNASAFAFSGGDFAHLNIVGSSRAELHSGIGSHVRAYDDSTLDIYGGDFGFVSAERLHPESNEGNGSVVNIYGGEIGITKTYWPSTMNIFGGNIFGINPLNAGATTNVHGGNIRSFSLNNDTVTNVYGTELALEFREVIHSRRHYTLTGRLEDGSSINANVALPSQAELNLIVVPEPRSLRLPIVLMCAVWTRRMRRRRCESG